MKLLYNLLLISALQAQPVRVLLVTGGHDHDPSFYSLFEGDKSFKTTIRPHPAAFSTDFRRNTDVLVLYDMVKTGLPENKRKHIREYLESGKGLVILHHAICSNTDWKWWTEEVAGGVYPESATFKHDETIPVRVKKQHPVTAGVPDFTIFDETYKGLWISPKVDVLLETSNITSDGPVAWIGPWAKSRVVFIQLGHGPEAHHNPHYIRLVRNAIQWVSEAPQQ